MGGEASREKTELADERVEAVGTHAEGARRSTETANGEPAVRSETGCTREIEGDGHGAARGNTDNISELEAGVSSAATAGANTSFDESPDVTSAGVKDRLNISKNKNPKDIRVVTEPGVLGGLRQSLSVASGIVLSANSETIEEQNNICDKNHCEASEMENDANVTKTSGLHTESLGVSTNEQSCATGKLTSGVQATGEQQQNENNETRDDCSQLNTSNTLLGETCWKNIGDTEGDDFHDATDIVSPDVGTITTNKGENTTPSKQTLTFIYNM